MFHAGCFILWSCCTEWPRANAQVSRISGIEADTVFCTGDRMFVQLLGLNGWVFRNPWSGVSNWIYARHKMQDERRQWLPLDHTLMQRSTHIEKRIFSE